MDTLFQGVEGIFIYMDDILVFSKNEQENLKTVEKVFKILDDNGLTIKLAGTRGFPGPVRYGKSVKMIRKSTNRTGFVRIKLEILKLLTYLTININLVFALSYHHDNVSKG